MNRKKKSKNILIIYFINLILTIMKKSLFFVAAASALMLTACSSENDVVQNAPQTQESVAQAVGFDTYLAGAADVTRAGQEGVMTTSTLQTTGFGVFASLSDNADYTSTIGPNFMYNQEVTYASPGWAYTPLKYWPNETTADMYNATGHATATELDKLSFFAYAPYVGTATGAYGITAMSANTVPSATDPTVTWTYSANPDQNVDLLWGVAPAGFSYTNVNGSTTSVPVGMPLLNLVKPDKDQKMKFLFQHALSRISLSVVSAIDQIAAGDDAGTFTSDPTTKVLIKSVTLTGTFGKTGVLNLNNDVANKANWTSTTKDAGTSALFTINGATVDGSTSGAAGNYYLAPDFRYVESQITGVGTSADNFASVNTGVLPSEQTLLSAGVDPNKKETNPAFVYGKVYYTAPTAPELGCGIATTTASEACDAYVKDGNDYKQVFATAASSKAPLDGNSAQLYKLTDGTALSTGATLAAATKYFKKTGTAGKYVYTEVTGDGTTTVAAGETYFTDASGSNTVTRAELSGDAYTGDCYSGLIPRYFMVIPTGNTDIKVNIKYAVVTKDEKLNGNRSDVENDITKTVNVDLKNGKSYNLKLVLGLTSVKLDATVADWKVDGSTEVDLPQNAE